MGQKFELHIKKDWKNCVLEFWFIYNDFLTLSETLSLPSTNDNSLSLSSSTINWAKIWVAYPKHWSIFGVDMDWTSDLLFNH